MTITWRDPGGERDPVVCELPEPLKVLFITPIGTYRFEVEHDDDGYPIWREQDE